jgi:hypothetical protein
MKIKKLAFLIVAHNEFDILRKLIILLDDFRNDIYVHVDKKAKSFDENQFIHLTKRSGLNFVRREEVSWGGYSQINCEFALLREALKNNYEYYHLLSGVDLPIKNQDEMHEYFNQHAGKEFLSYHHEILSTQSFYDRIQYFYFLQEKIGHQRGRNVLYQLNRVSLKLQELLGINRIKTTKPFFRKGCTWFSITHNLANFVVSQEEMVRKVYKYTQCADEIFIHTLAWNSDFRENIQDNSLRFIDWKRGRPYILRSDDFDLLMKSDAFWARKFSESVDALIVEKIFNHLIDQKLK